MGEVFESVDAGDAESITEGVIAPDDPRPVDEPDAEPGLVATLPHASPGALFNSYRCNSQSSSLSGTERLPSATIH
jgi:hypothetical protein